MKQLFCSLVFSSLTIFGQITAPITINAPAVTLDATGGSAVILWMSGQTTKPTTTLTAAIDNLTTTLTVASATGINVNDVLALDSGTSTEHCTVTAQVGKVITCTRGANGTTILAHASGVTVTNLRYKTFNGLGKNLIVNDLTSIVRQNITSTNAAEVAAKAAADAAIETKIVAAAQ